MAWYKVTYKNPYAAWAIASESAVQADSAMHAIKRWSSTNMFLDVPTGVTAQTITADEAEKMYMKIR